MKAYPVKHIIVRHSLKKSSSKRCCHLPLTLWLFFSSSSHFLHSLTVFPPHRFIQNSITLKEGSAREKWGTLSALSGLRVGPEECISLSHSHTNSFSNRRLRLYCLTTARQVDIEMMIYLNLSWEVLLLPFWFWVGRFTLKTLLINSEPLPISDVSGWLFISLLNVAQIRHQ